MLFPHRKERDQQGRDKGAFDGLRRSYDMEGASKNLFSWGGGNGPGGVMGDN